MRKSKAEIYFHLVWKTWERWPLVTPEIEREVYRCIVQEAERLNCTVLAIGGMPDHVHLAVRVPTKVSAAMIAQQVKGVSSTFVRDQLLPGELFRWQHGYGVFSFHRRDTATVVGYITNQKLHHAQGKTWDQWEESDESSEEEP